MNVSLLVLAASSALVPLHPLEQTDLAIALAYQEEIANTGDMGGVPLFVRVHSVQPVLAECQGSAASCPDVFLYITGSEGDLYEIPSLFRLPPARGWEFVRWQSKCETPSGEHGVGLVVRTALPGSNVSREERVSWTPRTYEVCVGMASAVYSTHSAQMEPFEGQIDYRIELDSIHPKLDPDAQRTFFGTGFTAVFKDGNYKYTYHESAIDTVWYRWKENREYTLMKGESVLHVMEASEPLLELVSTSNSAETLKMLDLELKRFDLYFSDDSATTIWYSPRVSTRPEWFRGLRFAGLHAFTSATSALPLHYERKTAVMNRREIATKITRRSVSDGELALPDLPRKPVGDEGED